MADMGNIEYTVSVETGQAFSAAEKFNKSLNNTERQVKKTDESSKRLNRSLSPLSIAMHKAFSSRNIDQIKATQSAMAGVKSMALKLAGALGVALSVKAIGSAVKANIDLADSTLNVADKLGTTTEEISKLRYAAEQSSGTMANEFDIAMQRMVRRLAEAAQGGGVAKDAINELGLDAQKLAASDPADAFKQIMEQMSKLPNQAERVRMAFKFFDSGGVKLAQTAKLGADGINELGDNLDRMGGVISTKTAQQAAAFNVKLGELQTRLSGVGLTLATEALPEMNNFVDLFDDPELMQNIATLGSALVSLGGIAVEVASEFGNLISQVSYFTKWVAGDTTQLEKLDAKISDVKRSLEGTGLNTTLGGMWYTKDELRGQLAELERQKAEIIEIQSLMDDIGGGKKTTLPTTTVSSTPLGGSSESTKESTSANKANTESLLANERALAALQEAINQTEMEARELAVRQAELGLNKYASPEQIKEAKELGGALYDARMEAQELAEAREQQRQLEEEAKQLTGEADQEKYETEIEQYQEMLDQKLISLEEFNLARDQAEEEYQQRQLERDEELFRNQSMTNELMMDALDGLASKSAGAFASVIDGSRSAGGAVKDLGRSILADLVGSMVEMGVQMAVNWAKAKMFEMMGVASSAATGASIAAAYAPAAAMASLASFGGNAIPAQTGIAATVGVAKTAALAGGRFYGGAVNADNLYKVNEGGKPEIFSGADGHQYMMPNQRGEVVSNKDASKGGGGGVTVIVNESPNARASVEQSQGDDGDTIISITVQDITGGGPIRDAIGSTFGLEAQGT